MFAFMPTARCSGAREVVHPITGINAGNKGHASGERHRSLSILTATALWFCIADVRAEFKLTRLSNPPVFVSSGTQALETMQSSHADDACASGQLCDWTNQTIESHDGCAPISVTLAVDQSASVTCWYHYHWNSSPNNSIQWSATIAVTRIPCEHNQLSLSGGGTVEPGSTLDGLSVIVICDGGPSPGVPVIITPEVDFTSGFHTAGHSTTRPAGSVSVPSGTTDSQGRIDFAFTAPAPAGTHSIHAQCAPGVLCNTPTPITITVKVEGLEPIPSSAFYTLSEADGSNIGDNGKHDGDNHYLTPEAIAVLDQLAFQYAASFDNPANRIPQQLHINDASLPWGGQFDITGNWGRPHIEHRRGTVVDIRANLKTGNIPETEFKRFNRASQKTSQELGVTVDAVIHCSKRKDLPPADRPKPPFCLLPDGTVDANRHFHVRLLGQKE